MIYTMYTIFTNYINLHRLKPLISMFHECVPSVADRMPDVVSPMVRFQSGTFHCHTWVLPFHCSECGDTDEVVIGMLFALFFDIIASFLGRSIQLSVVRRPERPVSWLGRAGSHQQPVDSFMSAGVIREDPDIVCALDFWWRIVRFLWYHGPWERDHHICIDSHANMGNE